MGGGGVIVCMYGVGGIDRWEWMMDSLLCVCVSVVLL